MERLNAKELDKVHASLKEVKRIWNVPPGSRSDIDKNLLTKAHKEVTDNLESFWFTLVETDLTAIRGAIFEDPQGYASVLRLKLPVLPTSASGQDKLTIEIVLNELHHKHVTLFGAIQEVQPAVRSMRARYDRCEKVFKGMYLTEKEWDSDAMFEILVPLDVREKLFQFEDMLICLETLNNAFNETFKEISRIVTLLVSEPMEIDRQPREEHRSEEYKPASPAAYERPKKAYTPPQSSVTKTPSSRPSIPGRQPVTPEDMDKLHKQPSRWNRKDSSA